eukprot:1728510-Lingulodinium_polyedra.AAC.1
MADSRHLPSKQPWAQGGVSSICMRARAAPNHALPQWSKRWSTRKAAQPALPLCLASTKAWL